MSDSNVANAADDAGSLVTHAEGGSKVVRCNNYRWLPPVREPEVGARNRDVTRQTLVGGEGEESLGFLTRYFEVQPGGFSALQRHSHPRCVVVVRGRGDVVLGDRVERIRPHDCIYVAPDTFHQFHAIGPDPLGYLCVLGPDGDDPEAPTEEDLERLRSRPAVARRMEV